MWWPPLKKGGFFLLLPVDLSFFAANPVSLFLHQTATKGCKGTDCMRIRIQRLNRTRKHITAIASSCSLFLSCFLFSPLNAQLANDKEGFKKIDTSAILQLIDSGERIKNARPDEALQLFYTALRQSEQGYYFKGIALASAKSGRWYFGNNVNKSIALASKALAIYEDKGAGSVENIAEAHLILAEAYDEQGRKDSSAYYYYLLGKEIETGTITNPIAAIDFYIKLTIFWVNLDYSNTSNSGYLETIQRYLSKAKEASKHIKDSADAASSIYFLQGAYYHGLGRYDSARFYYLDYIKEREKLNKMEVIRKISTLVNITDTYLQQTFPPDEAIKYIIQVKELGNTPQRSNFLVFFMTFTDLLMAKAMFQQKKYLPAIQLIDTTLKKLKTTGEHLRDEVVEAYKISADSYEALGDLKKALSYKNTYIQLHDSLLKKDRIDMINRLEIRYRIAEKDKELAEQKLVISEANIRVRQRNIMIIGICLLLLFGTALFWQWRRKNIHKQRLQQERIDNLQQKMEIERLNATIAGEEKERTRIARELHDGIGGLLSAAKMNFELVGKKGVEENDTDLRDGISLLQEAAAGLRDTAHNLMPEILLQEGLSRALDTFPPADERKKWYQH